MEINDNEFSLLRSLIYHHCGIVVNDQKKYLIIQRLGPILAEKNCRTFGEFYSMIKDLQPSDPLLVKTVEAITTNETSFFRDEHPFMNFRDQLLPELIKKVLVPNPSMPFSVPKLRIWSAASSFGQEAYSLAMCIMEYLKERNTIPYINHMNFQIIATDISREVIARAREGRYNQIEMARGLSEERRGRFFRKNGADWHIDHSVRKMVDFQQINLIKPFTSLGYFDIIFCRNVLIYFDDKTKSFILDQFHQMIPAHGHLVLGAMENTYNLSTKFESRRGCSGTIYYVPARRNPQAVSV